MRLLPVLLATTLTVEHARSFATSSGGFASMVLKRPVFVTSVGTMNTCLAASSADQESTQQSVSADDAVKNAKLDVTEGLNLLEDALRFNSSSASAILAKISQLRQESDDLASQYVEQLLSNGPDRSNLPFWTRSKRLAKFSRRARLASLRRTLDRTTPLPSPSSSGDAYGMPFRRRRALIALLKSIEEEKELTGTIVDLERKSLQSGKINAAEMRSRLPDGLETPSYKVLASKGTSVEIRHYEPYSVCAVSNRPANKETDAKVKMPEMSGASSFGALAGYLFGKNSASTAMKMTTPVFTAPSPEPKAATTISNDKQMQFVMPSQFWDENALKAAPQPLEGSGVTLQRVDASDRAVVMFGGYSSKGEVEKRKKQLMQILSKDKEWAPVDEDFSVAQYNDPFTVPWRRLNEVSVRVVPKN